MDKFNLAYNTIIIMDELKDHEHTNSSMREFLEDEAVVNYERRSMQATFSFLKRHDYIIIDENSNLLKITEAGHQFLESMDKFMDEYKVI